VPRQVLYFFTFGSPYAALADARIDDLVAAAEAELVPIPVAPVLDPPQGLAATLREFRIGFMREDCERCAAEQGLPWSFPWDEASPLDNVPASAGWYFAREKGRERGYRNAVFRARASEGRDVSDPQVLADCAAAAGLDRAEFLEALESGRYLEEVPKTLQLCMEHRCFGVPFFVVDGKHFWGNDRIEQLLRELA
jgi:2-hydroxychromene-2-carboxylate isomerase